MKRCTALLFCVLVFIYEFGDVHGKNGYPLNKKGNVDSCDSWEKSEDCEDTCKSFKGHGFCFLSSCYCEGISNDVKVFEPGKPPKV